MQELDVAKQSSYNLAFENFLQKSVFVHCAKHSTRCWAFFMVLLAEKRATKRREVAVATVNWQNIQKESLEFALFSPTTVFLLSYVQFQSTQKKNPAVGSFYETESAIWAGLDQLSNLKVVNTNIVWLIKEAKLRCKYTGVAEADGQDGCKPTQILAE